MGDKSFFFAREIANIKSVDLQDFVSWFFDTKVGEWFWKSGASSTGKFHPAFAKGEGGLVRHTRAVEKVCEELLRMSSYAYMKDEYKDYARVACLLHDVRKYGNDEENHDYYKDHGKLAAEAIAEAWEDFFDPHASGISCPELLLMAVRSHMGQWTNDVDNRPFTNIDRLVHMADYIASRAFWDIPELSAEYIADYNTVYFTEHPAEAALYGLSLPE